MKNVIGTILLAIFLTTSVANITVFGQENYISYGDDKKRDNKKKDPPGPVVVKDKDKKGDAPSERERPKKGKKPDQ
jgi:hypothetical protein